MTGPLDLLRDRTGAAALAAAEELVGTGGGDPLLAATALRSRGYGADLASAALTQATLRRRAAAKFGADAARMFFTAAGLEQATRGVVAERRARRLAAHGAGRVADLGCGIGADTVALARADRRVLAVEADPATAAVALANAEALGLADRVEVRCADATTVDLSDVDAVFCDPARRGGTGRRIFDPAAYSPPWSFVEALPGRVPATVVKVAPGFDHALIPAGSEAAWVSVDGDVVEATLWCGPLASVPRRATLLRGDAAYELTGTGHAPAPVGPIGRHLYEPDGAVVRAHLVADFAATVDGHLADPHIAYVFAEKAIPTPYGRCFEVLRTLPFARKRLRAALSALDIGALEILKRGLAVDPDELRRDLRLSGSRPATLVLARLGDTPTALLCSPVRNGPATTAR